MPSLESIIDDPTLMWDRRCANYFTITALELHCEGGAVTLIPSKLKKLDRKIINLYQDCGLVIKEYSHIHERLQELYNNPPVSVKDRAEYLREIQSLLFRLPRIMDIAQSNMASLANQLTEEKRKEYYKETECSREGLIMGSTSYDKSLVGRPIRQAQKELHQAAIECRTLLLNQIKRHSSDIPKELYMGMVTDDLKGWKEQLDELYHPETTDRQKSFAQLKARKDFIDSALSEILKQTDAQGEMIHESWREVRGVLDHDFSQAKFYADSRDENLAELSELLQSNLLAYREKSLLYEQKLVNQGAHLEAVDHAIKWMESPPQGTSWEDATQMIRLFMHANEKDADAAKFLHALNRWTKNQPESHSSDIPKELYMGMMIHNLKEWQDLLNKIYQPETTDSERRESFNQLRARKDCFDPALSEILKQTDAQGEMIHENWNKVRDVLDRDFSQAKFYTDSKDENLAELGELKQGDPQEYREKSLLYEQKLINQKAHQEAVDHAIKWMESSPQDVSWEDASQMMNLFMQANEKSTDAAKFLHALNCWAKNRLNLQSPNIPEEFYIRLVTFALKEWEELIDKIYQPEISDADRQEYLKQLRARKDCFDPALSEILKQTDAQGEMIHENWNKVRDVLDRDFSQAKFYTDSKDENLAELGELKQGDPQEYREKSLLYEQKLINQKAHQEAVDHAIKWMESSPQDVSWEDASQMMNLFMQANEKSTDAAKFLHALNCWAKNRLNLQSPNIPEEFYIRLVTFALKEWEELIDKIYQPEISDADRQEYFKQLQARKDNIYPALSEILKQADAKNEPIHEGWRTARSALEYDFSRAKFYADSIEGNLAELGELFQKNPQEYREKSLLYEQKLIHRGARQEAANYAIQWMESLSQDAAREDAIQMISLFLQANERDVDAAKFLHALNCWTKDQPDLHVDSEAYLPLQKEAEYIAIAKGMLYSNTDRELSFEAAEYYQVWQMARPDDPIPKVLLVRFHIANAEWDKSQQIIEKLPEQYSIPLSENRAIHMFNVYSLLLDVAETAILRSAIPFVRRKILPGSMGDQALDVLSSTVQGIFHQISRRYWMPRFLEDLSLISKEPLSSVDKTSLSIFAAQTISPLVLPPIFEFFSPNLKTRRMYLQPAIEFSNPVLGIAGSGLLTYGAYRDGTSLAKPATAFISSTVSLLGKAALRHNNDLSPTKRGIIMTSLKVLALAQDIQAIYANHTAIASVASYFAIRFKAQALHSKAENFLSKIPATRNSKVIAAASATGVVAYGIFFDFPRARTAAVLEEAIRFCHEQMYSEATDLLNTAKEWFSVWSDRSVIEQYIDCISFLKQSFTLKNNTTDREWLENAVPDVHKTIETLEKSDYYSNAKDDLLCHVVIAYLNTEQIEQARIILSSIDISSTVHGHIVFFVIENAKKMARGDLSKVDFYLNEVKPTLQIPEYLEIVTKYQQYFAFQKQYPTLPEDRIDEKDRIISSLIKLIRPRTILRQLEEDLLFEMLLLYINTEDSAKKEELLNQTSSRVHEQLALLLIGQAIEWSQKNEFDEALRLLNRGIVLNEFTLQPLLMAFKAYIESQKTHPLLSQNSPPDEIDLRISILDSISQNAGKIDVFPFVQREKLFLYIQVEKFQEAADWVEQHPIKVDAQNVIIFTIAQNALKLPDHEAFDYLNRAHEAFLRFEHGDIFLKLQEYLVSNKDSLTTESVGKWFSASESLIAALRPIQQMSDFILAIRFRQFEVFLMHGDFQNIKQVLEQDEISLELRGELQERLIGYFVHQSFKLEKFEEITRLLDISDLKLAKRYKAFHVSLMQHFSEPTSISNIQESVRQIKALSDLLEKTLNTPAPNWIISDRADLHCAAGHLYWQAHNFNSSLEEFSQAEALLLEQHLPENEEKLTFIRHIKEKALALT